MSKPIKPAAVEGPTLDDAANPQVFSTKTFAWVEYTPIAVQFMADSSDYVESVATTVDGDAQAVEASRVQVVSLEAAAQEAATQSALSAAASQNNGIDPAGYEFGDSLMVVPDGNGGKRLALDSSRRERVAAVNGTAPSLDLNVAQGFTISLTGDTVFTFDTTGFLDLTGNKVIFTVLIEQGSTAHDVTWPASVVWDRDVIPALPGANEIGEFVFSSYDGGVRWIGARVMRAAA